MTFRLLVASLLFHSVSAFPSGAGSCPEGTAAVGGSHLTRDITTGSLSDGSLGVTLNGVPLVDGVAVDFPIGEDHTLTLSGSGSFRGFLFRLGGTVDTTAALTNVDGDGQVATGVCVNGQGVGGVTHTLNDLKSSVSATLRLDEVDTNMPLDVTVVIENRGSSSVFYYTSFVLNAVESVFACNICGDGNTITNPDGFVTIPGQGTFTCSQFQAAADAGAIPEEFCGQVPFLTGDCGCVAVTDVPTTPAPVTPAPVTPAPVAPPTPAPVAPPTPAPVAPPTPAPVAPPTPAPVVPPTPAPVAPPTPAPVAPPTPAPVVPPTPAPVAPPTAAPVAPPTPAPVAPPTPAPVAPPTPAPVAPTDAPVSDPTEVPVMAPTEPPTTPSPMASIPVDPQPTAMAPSSSKSRSSKKGMKMMMMMGMSSSSSSSEDSYNRRGRRLGGTGFR